MKQEIDQFTARHDLLKKGEKLVAAVSGGPDSMAMLHYLSRQPIELSVLHVHHLLREEAEEEAELVKKTAEALDLPFFLRRVNVKDMMKESGTGLQQTARTERYRLFQEVMEETGSRKTATAHHGDDQIETMLMRFTRGSIQGMKGIPVRRPLGAGEVIRPMLGVTKDAIEAYCAEHRIPYRVDISNENKKYMRSRIRHEIVPVLKKENPRLHEAAQWQAEIRAEEESYLNEQAEAALASVILEKKDGTVLIQKKSFAAVPAALQKRAVHLLLTYLRPEALWTRSHVQAVQDLFISEKRPHAAFTAHDLHAETAYETVLLQKGSPESEQPWTAREADVPSRTELPWGVLFAGAEAPADADVSTSIAVSTEELPLIVRPRKPGDRIRTSAGTKKLKKIFIDEKIPAKERERWPIITNRHGTILWVPFLYRAEGTTDFGQTNKQTVQLAYIKKHENR
jgi:tRNA(Ile)-lysidine synthase